MSLINPFDTCPNFMFQSEASGVFVDGYDYIVDREISQLRTKHAKRAFALDQKIRDVEDSLFVINEEYENSKKKISIIDEKIQKQKKAFLKAQPQPQQKPIPADRPGRTGCGWSTTYTYKRRPDGTIKQHEVQMNATCRHCEKHFPQSGYDFCFNCYETPCSKCNGRKTNPRAKECNECQTKIIKTYGFR